MWLCKPCHGKVGVAAIIIGTWSACRSFMPHVNFPYLELSLLPSHRRYGIVLQKGYQKTGPVSSVVTTKVKGASVYNGTEDYTQNCIDGEGLSTAPWDVGDLIIPPEVSCLWACITDNGITKGKGRDLYKKSLLRGRDFSSRVFKDTSLCII